MELILVSLLFLAGAAFALLAVTLGVDSREGSNDPHRPADPVGIT